MYRSRLTKITGRGKENLTYLQLSIHSRTHFLECPIQPKKDLLVGGDKCSEIWRILQEVGSMTEDFFTID